MWIWALEQPCRRFHILYVADKFWNLTKNSSITILRSIPICWITLIPGFLNYCRCSLYTQSVPDTILCIFLVCIVQLCLEYSERRISLRKIQPLSSSLRCNSTQWKWLEKNKAWYRYWPNCLWYTSEYQAMSNFMVTIGMTDSTDNIGSTLSVCYTYSNASAPIQPSGSLSMNCSVKPTSGRFVTIMRLPGGFRPDIISISEVYIYSANNIGEFDNISYCMTKLWWCSECVCVPILNWVLYAFAKLERRLFQNIYPARHAALI